MKNFEAVFLAAVVMATVTAFATAEAPRASIAKAASSAPASAGAMQVVVIKAKRLSQAEKAALN